MLLEVVQALDCLLHRRPMSRRHPPHDEVALVHALEPFMALAIKAFVPRLPYEALERFVWQTVHKRFYGRRHEWFERMDERYFVMWWVPAEHRPTVQEALERLRHLRQHGPSDHAFGWESLPAAQLWKSARCA